MNPIEFVDPEIWASLQNERKRQQTGLEMIASENYTSAAILAAQGSVLTNKYAEGYPGKRYYGGCEYVDEAEKLAINRAMKLFDAPFANVQPHSGASANMAVYFAALQPGDTIVAMNLSHGGHLTHGMHLNFSGKLYKVHHYGVKESDGRLDYDQVAALCKEHKPKLVVAGGQRLCAHHRFRPLCRDLSRKWCPAHGGYGPHRWPCRGRSTPQPRPLRGFCHLHNPQNPPGAARGFCPRQKRVGPQNQSGRFSGPSRRAVDACHCRQSNCLS